MIISAIAAMARNRGIGKNNLLPWHIPEDFKYFKDKTLGKILIMGRKTFESLPKPLPNRVHIVITRDKEYLQKIKIKLSDKFNPMDFYVVDSLEKSIELAKNLLNPSEPGFKDSFGQEVFISGGSEIYQQSLKILNRLYLTVIDQDYESDAFFPDFSDFGFHLISTDPRPAKPESNIPAFSFLVFEKNK